ncbi:MAG: hypothetical protein INR72_17260 [Williamsia herbipolensis]|nr:hypothetical protein [Williamsia herbipolensis]
MFARRSVIVVGTTTLVVVGSLGAAGAVSPPRAVGWSADHRLTTTYQQPVGEPGQPQLATNAAGDVASAWRGTDGDAYVAVHDGPGTGWTTPYDLGPSEGGELQLGLNAHGRVLVVWVRPVPGDNAGRARVLWAQRPAGGSWSATRRIHTATGPYDPYGISLSVAQTRNGALAYARNGRAWVQIFAHGTWAAPVRMSPRPPKPKDDTTLGATDPAVSYDGSGRVRAEWEWVTDGGEGGEIGRTEVGGLSRRGRPLPVHRVPVPCCAGPYATAQSRTGQAFAFWNETTYRFEFHLAHGHWFDYRPPIPSGETSDTATLAVADDSAYVWWDVRSAHHAAIEEATYVHGAWSRPHTIVTAPSGYFLISSAAADPFVSVVGFGLSHSTVSRRRYRAAVWSRFGRTRRTYRFAPGSGDPDEVAAVAVGGSDAALTWAGHHHSYWARVH